MQMKLLLIRLIVTGKHVRSIKPLLVAQIIPPEGETAQAIPYSPSPNA